MAWVTLTNPSKNYITNLQRELLNMCNDDKVLTGINQIIADITTPYVPMDNGEFHSSVETDYPGRLRDSVQVGPKEIRWTTQYAHYVYRGDTYGPNIPIHPKGDPHTIIGFYSPKGETKYPTGARLNYTTANTGSLWFNTMIEQQRRTMSLRITNYLKRECKKRGLS